MFRVKIRQRRPREQWRLIGDVKFDSTNPVKLTETEASESDHLSFQIFPPPDSAPSIHIFVGSVLVASSIPTDRVALIDYDDSGDTDLPVLSCRGRLLANWVGITELIVEVRLGDSPQWARVLMLPLAVSAGKLETEEFNQLFTELERDSAAVLLDVYGKTQIGIKGVQPPASSAPVAVLSRLRETVRDLNTLLRLIARQPAFRLRSQLSREQALVGQAISESTLAEACRDPNLLRQRGSGFIFHEHLREHSRRDYRVPEHQVLADFSEYLKAQLADLRYRIDAEIADREARKRWRNLVKEPGQPTWWESEDLPRIEQLQRCRQEVAQLRGTVDDWCSLPFVPLGRCLRHKPQSTPLFRINGLYQRAFRVISRHFLTYQASLDTHDLLTRARSLPVLYEWWCAVQVIRILSHGLTPLIHDPVARPIISTQLAHEGRRRFTIEFASDQAISFTDSQGARVRFRYQPEYLSSQRAAGLPVAVLDAGSVRMPDMAVEVFPAHSSTAEVPELIIVLDAKYSSESQGEKMTKVTTKYSKIGNAKTGRILSRQVWALTPAAPDSVMHSDGLRHYCTVDNEAFWSDQFDLGNPVNGAVQTRPITPGSFDPLRNLIMSLLKLAGVDYSEPPELQTG